MLPYPTREMRRHRRHHAACRAVRPLRSNAPVLPAVLPGPGQFNAAGVFAAVLILVLVGVVVTELLTRLERGSAPAVLPF